MARLEPFDGSGPIGDVFGFYRTSEGREFLRDAYRRYLKRPSSRQKHTYGDTKVASLVADRNYQSQLAEDRKTRAALKRWAEDGQRELWRNDADKTLRVLARLEAEMMAEPDIAEIFEDRASTLRKTTIANSLSSFFYGEKYQKELIELSSALKKYEGVFAVLPARDILLNLEGYCMERLFTYCRFELHPDYPFLVAQEVTIADKEGATGLIYRRSRSGFVFVGYDGALVRFVVSLENPWSRWVEVYRPMREPHRGHLDYAEQGLLPDDLCFHIEMASVSSVDGELVHEDRAMYLEGVVFRKENSDISDEINKHFASVMWDIPL